MASLNPSQRAKILKGLSEAELEELEHEWRFWARKEQTAPDGHWAVWMALAGRGFGKTEAGAQWVKERGGRRKVNRPSR